MSFPNEQHKPDSLWRASTRHESLDCAALKGEASADAVVIGGGFCGLSTALHLAEAGLDTIVLEAYETGHGASGRNGGQVNPGCKLSRSALEKLFGPAGGRFHALCESAPDFLSDLIDRKQFDCGFKRPGTLRLAHSEQALRTVELAARDLEAQGVKVRVLDRVGAAKLLGSDAYLGGMVDPRGGSLHPLELCRELARAAVVAGVKLYEQSPALAMKREGCRWVVRTPSGKVSTDQVIVATNAYTGSLSPKLSRSVLPVNSFQVATAPLAIDAASRILPDGHAAYDSRRLVLYFRKTKDRRLVLGGRASFSSKYGESSKIPDYSVLERTLQDIFPLIGGIQFEKRWTGLVCITPDFLPHYHNPEPGLHMVLGFNGRGVAVSTMAGAWLASKLAGNQFAEFEIPSTPIRTIPFHFLRAPFLNAAMQWGRLMDRLGI